MTKNILESRFYRWLDVAASFLFLNLAWLVACLPIATVYPATAAMFAVVREWVRKGEFDGAITAFVSFFKKGFKQSFGVGMIWTFFGAALVVNWFLISGMPDAVRVPLYACFVAVGFVYVMASMFLFPVLVHYDVGWRGVLKNSTLLSLSQFPTTFGCLAVLAVSVAAAFFLPAAILIAGSVAAYAIYRLCEGAFQKVASAKRGDDAPRNP